MIIVEETEKLLSTSLKQFQQLTISIIPALKKMNVFATFVDIVVDYNSISKDKVIFEARIREDLGFDSLDFVELLIRIEDKFGFDIRDEEAEKIVKVSDWIDLINKKVNSG